MSAGPYSSNPVGSDIFALSQQELHYHQYRTSIPPMGGVKVPIVEPPGVGSRSTPAPNEPAGDFPSPGVEYGVENGKFHEDKARLTHAVEQAVPEAVRVVFRNHWQKVLGGSRFHQSFILAAVLHSVDDGIARQAVRDYGYKLISGAAREVINYYHAADFDATADIILSRCSNEFLDKALERRLKTIDARSLVNALARAERLGYEEGDVVDGSKGERVVARPPPPHPQPPVHTSNSSRASPPHAHGVPAPQSNAPGVLGKELQCQLCWRKFTSQAPYNYHVTKRVCTKKPPDSGGFPFACAACGAGFVTKMGLQYHKANNVCGDHGTAPATPPVGTTSSLPAIEAPNYNTQHGQSATPGPPPQVASSYTATPSQTRWTPVVTSVSKSNDDPYSHLKPDVLARLNFELKQAEISYAPRFREVEALPDPAARKAKLEALQNSFTTKQSTIRKRYGVRLRNRRTRAEIEQERHRMSGATPGSDSTETPSAKRQRMDDGNLGEPTRVRSIGPDKESLSPHIPLIGISGGLEGSVAAETIRDPTTSFTSVNKPTPVQAPAGTSLSTLQRRGYRVSAHVGLKSPDVDSTSRRVGSDIAPSEIEDATPTESGSDSGSDSDEDSDEDGIPASLPPGSSGTGNAAQKARAA